MKPFKIPSAMDPSSAQKTWMTLKDAIEQIYNRNASSLSFEELYRSSYNLVLNKHGEMLYLGVCESIKNHLLIAIKQIVSTENECILESILLAWNDHKITTHMIKDVLMYMDKTYVPQHKKIPIYNMAVLTFRSIIHNEVRDRLIFIVLRNIEMERNGHLIDRDLMKNILTMLVELSIDGVNVYEEDFECYFIEKTRSFYRLESEQYIMHNSSSDFINQAEKRLLQETNRVRHYLSPSTEPKLKNVMEFEFISSHARTLIDMDTSGFFFLLRANSFDDLKKMYILFCKVPSTLDMLRECMCQAIKTAGTEIVQDQNTKDSDSSSSVQFVNRILELKHKYETIIQNCFNNEKKAQKKLKDSFEHFLNIDSAKCALHLACFCDELLKGGGRGGRELVDAELQIDRVISIFNYISDKDVFESIYRQQLSKRLLNGRSSSDDAEKLMITKLKSECGQQFTSKMEGMFLDMHLSKEIMDQFRCTPLHGTCPVELEVQTLTASHWALVHNPLALPPPLQDCCSRFAAFYLQKFKTGRRLTWMTHVGSVDIKGLFAEGRRELTVSVLQASVLMQFNDKNSVSLPLLRAALGGDSVGDAELRRHVLSLCIGKTKILNKASKGKGLEDDDIISFNDQFSTKFKRIKVPLLCNKDSSLADDGSKGASAAVEEDRRHLVEASIVRLMKTRKTMTHNDLVAETSRQLSLRFCPAPQFIKNRIESLIEREYIAREADMRSYRYLA